VTSLEVEWEKDLFHIVYEPGKVTPEKMLEVVRQQGFEGTVLANAPVEKGK
jgi:hypothetical protein